MFLRLNSTTASCNTCFGRFKIYFNIKALQSLWKPPSGRSRNFRTISYCIIGLWWAYLMRLFLYCFLETTGQHIIILRYYLMRQMESRNTLKHNKKTRTNEHTFTSFLYNWYHLFSILHNDFSVRKWSLLMYPVFVKMKKVLPEGPAQGWVSMEHDWIGISNGAELLTPSHTVSDVTIIRMQTSSVVTSFWKNNFLTGHAHLFILKAPLFF